ncbi:RNA polymerase subunit sigma-70 [Pedobacter yonginense]|uniref:RNA polymerase subunit sigma-70 n=1 Tax=Pedobacter yonginense TaxID=651869 RepID=A0A317EII9_9SPHI|nr:sigma-70 family RNA polymerase sigma factor [Pedobacter yonginense]PWS26650.1 RNA polymerase subunit sigma-70 [Pedobacter yonginense]
MAIAKKTELPGNNRDAWLKALYKDAFPLVAKYVAKTGGSIEEARDVFQDALIIYYEKRMEGQLILQYSEKTYVFGITRYLWNKRLRKYLATASIDALDAEFEENISFGSPDDKQICSSSLFKLLQSSGKKCMDLLNAFYYEKMPMDKLALEFGFSGARSATAQKFKCLEKVKHTVKKKSIHYADILE